MSTTDTQTKFIPGRSAPDGEVEAGFEAVFLDFGEVRARPLKLVFWVAAPF